MNRGLMAAGLLLALLWVVSAESAWAAADEEPKVILQCVPMKPPRALDALTTEAWVAELREGPVAELTEAGEKAAPILAAALKDPRAALWTRHMLTSVKGDRKWTIPVLAVGLDNLDRNERGWSLGALKRLGPDAAPAVPAVVAALKSWCADGRLRDEEERNGRDAIELLGQIGPAAREAVDLLVAIFESEPTMPTPGRGSCRFDVMKTLGQIGPDAVPAVCDMVGRNTDDPQGFSMRTNLTYYRPETLRPVLENLSSKQVHRRRGAVDIVAVHVRDKQRLPADKDLAAALIPLLEDEDQAIRNRALDALVKMPQEAAAAVPKLIPWMGDEHKTIRHAAAGALALIGPPALPALRDAARSADPNVRFSAALAIGEMKPVPESEIPLLISLATDADDMVRCWAVAALGDAGHARPEVLKTLIQALDDAKASWWASEALGKLGPAASSAVVKLTTELSSAEPEKRVKLAEAIWRIEPASPAVLPALIEVLKDTQTPRNASILVTRTVDGKQVQVWEPMTDPISCCASEVLQRMGPAAAPAVRALIEAANSGNKDAAYSAVQALSKIGPAAQQAVPALRRLQDSADDFYVRRAASEALEMIDVKPNPKADKLGKEGVE